MAKLFENSDLRRAYLLADQGMDIPELEMVGWTQFNEAAPRGLGPHQHQGCYELCYIRRGSPNWWVGHEHFTVRPGELFLTWPDELHGGQGNRMDACEIYWVIFSLDARRGSFAMDPELTRHLGNQLQANPYRICQADETITDHFKRVLEEIEAPGLASAAVIRASMMLLLHDTMQAYARSGGQTQRHQTCSPRMEACLQWLADHCHQHPSIDIMAKQVGLKPSHFRTVFRKETGYGPQEYLTLLLINRAKERLVVSKQSITDIAFDLGFSSSQYFSTTFRKVVGMTPRAFRAEAGAEGVMYG